MWKSLCSLGNLLLQNIVVSFSRGHYCIAPLSKQTSCQTAQADADRFYACTAAYCQDSDNRHTCQELDVVSQSVDRAGGDAFNATRLRIVPVAGRPHRLR